MFRTVHLQKMRLFVTTATRKASDSNSALYLDFNVTPNDFNKYAHVGWQRV